jgi:Zn-dependent alcohol dehydrogenase
VRSYPVCASWSVLVTRTSKPWLAPWAPTWPCRVTSCRAPFAAKSVATWWAITCREGRIDAVGDSSSIAASIKFTRPRGRVVLLGMPAEVTVDLTGLWHRETQLVGAYTYGTENLPDGSRRHTFDLAIELARTAQLDRLLSATYHLDDYEQAIAHAAAAGRRGAVKIAFDLRPPHQETR